MNTYEKTGRVIWLTGLSGAGKTTISNRLAAYLVRSENGVEVLDGDQIRKGLSADLGFSEDDRNEHNRRVIFLTKLLVRNGIDVIVALVSPYRETRKVARQEFNHFTEVYVKCSLKECMKRDPKGLYARALEGEIADMTGLQSPYEAPLSAEVVVDTEFESPEQSVRKILVSLGEGAGCNGHAEIEDVGDKPVGVAAGFSERAGEKSLIPPFCETTEVVEAHVC